MIRRNLKERTNEGYEVQWYNEQGNNSHVTQCDTAEELAAVLARACWGSIRFKQNPTVWYYGERFCFGEYEKVDPVSEETPFVVTHTLEAE